MPRRRRSALSAIKHMRFTPSEKSPSFDHTNAEGEAKIDAGNTHHSNDEIDVTKSSADVSISLNDVSSRSSSNDVTISTQGSGTNIKQQQTNDDQTTMNTGGEENQFIVKSSSFRVCTHQASPGVRFSFMRTYSHTQQSSSGRATSNSFSSRAGSFGSSAVTKPLNSPHHRRTKTVLCDKDHPVVKSRRISTPDLINRRHLLRQKSVESLEQLRTLRENIHLRNVRTDSLLQSTAVASNDDLRNTQTINTSRPTRKLSNFFRKISLSTSKNLKQHPVTDSIAGGFLTRNHNNNNLNERDILVGERDRALEEWSESAKKCEELIDELDITLSELMDVSVLFVFSFLSIESI